MFHACGLLCRDRNHFVKDERFSSRCNALGIAFEEAPDLLQEKRPARFLLEDQMVVAFQWGKLGVGDSGGHPFSLIEGSDSVASAMKDQGWT
jgi:hypothetical protein